MDDREHRLIRAAYWAMVDLLDRQIGRILDALERTGQRENTIVVFHADHGEMLGDHGLYLKGPYFYDPAVRVPLILNWPRGLPAGRRVGGLVELVDVAPTLLDAAGADPEPGIQGRSLLPLIDGAIAETAHRADVYSEFYHAGGPHDGRRTYATMIRSADRKIVAYHGGDTDSDGELYCLDEDPGENVNRWNDPGYLPIKASMLQRMVDRMALTVDPLPVRDDGW
jgi:arylsulfatase A-like enzyme